VAVVVFVVAATVGWEKEGCLWYVVVVEVAVAEVG